MTLKRARYALLYSLKFCFIFSLLSATLKRRDMLFCPLPPRRAPQIPAPGPPETEGRIALLVRNDLRCDLPSTCHKVSPTMHVVKLVNNECGRFINKQTKVTLFCLMFSGRQSSTAIGPAAGSPA